MTKKSRLKMKAITEFLMNYQEEKGYPPSIREIGQAVGLKSPSTVHEYLRRLEDEGVIRRDPTKPRAIELKKLREETPPTAMVSMIGSVAAGQPLLAYENVEAQYPLPLDWTNGDNCFMLRVVGESMIEAGILDGDFIIVSRDAPIRQGDIAVALIDNETTVKRFYEEPDGRIRLQPENSLMAPICVREVELLGRVISLIRTEI